MLPLKNLYKIVTINLLQNVVTKSFYLALLNYNKTYNVSQKPVNTGKKKSLLYLSWVLDWWSSCLTTWLTLNILWRSWKELCWYWVKLIEIEEVEVEPSLSMVKFGPFGYACFIDSISTLGLTGMGFGLNYHYGLFNKSLKTTNKSQFQMHGWLTKTGWCVFKP